TWKARRRMILWLGGMLWPWGWSICSGLSRLKSLSRRRNRRLSRLDRGAVRIGAGAGGAERLLVLRTSTLGIRLLRAGPELAGYLVPRTKYKRPAQTTGPLHPYAISCPRQAL